MKAYCYYCESTIELEESDIEVAVFQEYNKYIGVTVIVPCPDCGDEEVQLIQLENFTLEKLPDNEWRSNEV